MFIPSGIVGIKWLISVMFGFVTAWVAGHLIAWLLRRSGLRLTSVNSHGGAPIEQTNVAQQQDNGLLISSLSELMSDVNLQFTRHHQRVREIRDLLILGGISAAPALEAIQSLIDENQMLQAELDRVQHKLKEHCCLTGPDKQGSLHGPLTVIADLSEANSGH